MAIVDSYVNGKIVLTCTACQAGTNLGTFDNAADAWKAARDHHCEMPQVIVQKKWPAFGDMPAVEVLLGAGVSRYTLHEAKHLMAALSMALLQYEAHWHDNDSVTTEKRLFQKAKSAQ